MSSSSIDLCVMKVTTNLRKMRTSLFGEEATYVLPMYDVIEPIGLLAMNALVGAEVRLTYEKAIHCIETGKKIQKTFGEGLSYEAFLTSPLATPSIIRPELSRIHEGIALRDREWEEAHHNQPHVVYLSRTSDIKVGVTRTANVPSRWIDQGATEAILLAETPYRQLAGVIEVALKEHLADKTNWQTMLKTNVPLGIPLPQRKDQVLQLLDESLQEFYSDNDEVTSIHYPVLHYPSKVQSLKFDTTPEIQGKLLGIKAQYLLFEGGRVLNIRSHAGYRITIETE